MQNTLKEYSTDLAMHSYNIVRLTADSWKVKRIKSDAEGISIFDDV